MHILITGTNMYLLQNTNHIDKRIYISQTKDYYAKNDNDGDDDDFNNDF